MISFEIMNPPLWITSELVYFNEATIQQHKTSMVSSEKVILFHTMIV